MMAVYAGSQAFSFLLFFVFLFIKDHWSSALVDDTKGPRRTRYSWMRRLCMGLRSTPATATNDRLCWARAGHWGFHSIHPDERHIME